MKHETTTNPSLYDYLKLAPGDYDTYDTEYECIVTVCAMDKATDSYEKFCAAAYKKVNVIRKQNYFLTVNWCELIKRNYQEFREFSKKYWSRSYKDEDEFIYQWIREINLYIAGYVSESLYDTLYKFFSKLQ